MNIGGVSSCCTAQIIHGWSASNPKSAADRVAVSISLQRLNTLHGRFLKDNKVLTVFLTQTQRNRLHDYLLRIGFVEAFTSRPNPLQRHPESGPVTVYCADPVAMHDGLAREILEARAEIAARRNIVLTPEQIIRRRALPTKMTLKSLYDNSICGRTTTYHPLSRWAFNRGGQERFQALYGFDITPFVDTRWSWGKLMDEYKLYRNGEGNDIDAELNTQTKA